MTLLDVDFDPHARFSAVPAFTVTSDEVEHGRPLADEQYAAWLGGADVSPGLSWSGAPKEARSYAVTCWDPDAPTGSGYWHWAVVNVPETVTSLPPGAGAEGGDLLPAGAYMLPNESRAPRFEGCGPPPGTGEHRYIFTVHALDVPRLDIGPDATPAILGFHAGAHGIARAQLTGTASFESSPAQRRD